MRRLAHIAEAASSAGADRRHAPSNRNAIGLYACARFSVDAAQPDAAVAITWMTLPLRGPGEQACQETGSEGMMNA